MGERADVTRDYGQPTDATWQSSAPEPTSEASPEELRVEIEQTRMEMSGTIDALQEKLNPDRLKEQVTDAVREQVETVTENVKENIREATVGRAEQMVSNMGDTAQRASSSFLETIKQNPIPAALAALGIGWLWTKRSGGQAQPSSYRATYDGGSRGYYANAGARPYYGTAQNYGQAGYDDRRGQGFYAPGQDDLSVGDRVGDVAGQARDTVGNVAGQTKDKVGDIAGQAKDAVGNVASQAQDRAGQFAGQAQDQVGEWSDQVQYGARQAKYRFDQTLSENPLAVSAAAVAIGLAVGLSLPDTPVEDRLMGEARDSVMEKAKAQAQDTVQKVGQVAQQVQETAKTEAQKQGLTGGDGGASSKVGTQNAQRGQQSGSQQSGSQWSGTQQSGTAAGVGTPSASGMGATTGTSTVPRQTGQQSTQQPSSTTTP